MSGMKRDFSQANVSAIQAVISEVENDGQWGIADFFGDLFSCPGEAKDSLADLREFHNQIIDKQNIGQTDFEKVLKNVKQVDNSFKRRIGGIKEKIECYKDKTETIGKLITPSVITAPSWKVNSIITTMNNQYAKLMGRPEVFDEDGNGVFGADQGSLQQKWDNDVNDEGDRERIRNMIEKVMGKKMSDEEIKEFLNNLNNEGCGYAAATNIILSEFAGREVEFKEKFGIDYYDKDGNVNFEELLLDFYYHQDNFGPGAIGPRVKADIKNYCRDHDVDLTGNLNGIYTESEIKQQLSEGKLITMTCYIPGMKFEGRDDPIDWHTVTIVGFDEVKGKFIISSWGNKYYLDELPKVADMYVY